MRIENLKRLVSAGPTDRFRIYLNDHRALLVAEHALAVRSLGANNGSELGHLLQTVIDQNGSDQTAVDQLLERAGGSPNPFKRVGAVIGERFGRLKLNGQLRGYSPLSRVIEVEALLASTAMRGAMWDAIAVMGDDDAAAEATTRAENAHAQLARLGEHHVEAVMRAFNRGDLPRRRAETRQRARFRGAR